MPMLLSEIIPSRSLNLLYIILDSLFLVFFLILLLVKKKYLTVLIALFGGILYFLVDYLYFYHITGSRTLTINGESASELQMVFYLLWHELSSGFTNFALIWLCLNRGKDTKYYVFLVVLWWLVCPAIASLGGEATISCARTTDSYHANMAIILFVGYAALIVYNLLVKDEKKRVDVFYLFAVGFLIQFAWEGAFLLYGIRPWNDSSLQTLLIDSLIETNLGMPIFYFLHKGITHFRNEDLSKPEPKEAA
ncbi:MAG: hypothetical protein Q4F15_05805 [Bacillota bacterium]|nr:hypothetical protein [Bacillota bacterium]